MPGKRHPSIIIYDLPNTITDQEVQEALRTYTEDAENIRTRFKLKGRKPDTSHWVMEAPRQHFLQLKRFRKIAVNWNLFQIKEFFHVKRCQFCQAFGHTRQLQVHCSKLRNLCRPPQYLILQKQFSTLH
ncbi:hypothetical protein AVEN_160632-1 [Araneus ventricosus]|uniref:Uncharacterized protein n=1 Tax=Araneus ventricosus TaxID=182803 RepID=A0A4Y2UHU9_ARAVE|nr:hypothetical protein AVEN_160632-1 [Araneus ventricosus]